jgi:hypothetical protein
VGSQTCAPACAKKTKENSSAPGTRNTDRPDRADRHRAHSG